MARSLHTSKETDWHSVVVTLLFVLGALAAMLVVVSWERPLQFSVRIERGMVHFGE